MICFPLDNTPYEAKDMGTYLATRTRGVFSSDGNLAVTPGESGLSVSVSPGLAWLKWSDYWGTAALQEQALTLDLDTADGALKRIDAIVCRLDKVNNRAEIVVKKGAPSSAPIVVPPVRDANYDELYIATVLIGAGIVSISASAITDQRLNEEYCGLMRDGVTGIPTAQLQTQVQQLIDHLRDEINGVEQGSKVMLKTVYDADGDGVVDEAAVVPWGGVTGKPDTFTPSTHNHDDRYYTEAEMDTKLAGKANSSHTHTKDQVGLGNVDNTADANKTVLEAKRLKVRTTSSLVVTDGNGLYYYPANAQDLPPNNQDGLLLFITYGAWGAQLAFPTGGGVYYRYGTTTFSAWLRRIQHGLLFQFGRRPGADQLPASGGRDRRPTQLVCVRRI